MNDWIKAINRGMYTHTWSLMDVVVVLLIIPHLCNEYSMWFLLLILPWVMYSNRLARIWSE